MISDTYPRFERVRGQTVASIVPSPVAYSQILKPPPLFLNFTPLVHSLQGTYISVLMFLVRLLDFKVDNVPSAAEYWDFLNTGPNIPVLIKCDIEKDGYNGKISSK